MLPPVIVNISRLHRETAAVVQQADESDCPVFVTQHAYVTAVLLPRRMYERLLRAAEKGATAEWGDRKRADRKRADQEEGGRGRRDRIRRGDSGGQDSWTTAASPLADPLAVFGSLPPRTRFLTKHGVSVDAELAAFLMEDGEQVRPILERWPEEDDAER